MNKKFEHVTAGFSGQPTSSFFRLRRRTDPVFLVFALMAFLVPVVWGGEQVFSVTEDGQYSLLPSRSAESLGTNQVQGDAVSIPLTNPGAEAGDLTGWLMGTPMGSISAVDSVYAYQGNFYFGHDPQFSFSLGALDTKYHNYGELASETIDLSGLGAIQDFNLTGYYRNGGITVELLDNNTGESTIYSSTVALGVTFYDAEDDFLAGRSRGRGVKNWTQGNLGGNSWGEAWNEFGSRIDHMKISLNAYFWAGDVSDYNPEPGRYEIVSYSWTGADGNQYSGDMSNYSGDQLPIVGFDDIALEVDGGTSVACNTAYTLPPNEWHQIAMPCDPGENNTVEAVLGDDGLGAYGTNWRVFRYDTSSNTYDFLEATDTLKQGEGYWINQLNEVPKTLAMPVGSVSTPVTYPSGCNNDAGCFQIPLTTQNSANQWNMIGYPFETSSLLNNAVVTGVQSCASAGCSLDEAMTKGVVHNELWTYSYDDGVKGYIKLVTTVDSGNTTLNPWKGYWAATLGNAAVSAPINLLIRR